MSIETIARRYSTALADVSLSHGDSGTIKNELEMVSKLFQENAELRTVFGNPAITHENKEKVLNALIVKIKPSGVTSNFLKVLLQNGRLNDITEINNRFGSVLEERSGSVSAEIISARELPAREQAEFESHLQKITGKKVIVNYRIDSDIIGGVVTRIGSTVYDGSVRTKLENLKEQLISG
jgi:F-type H+-transporting ATPase subunit delta